MAFWSVAGPEPKRNYRWVVRFGGNTSLVQAISFALKKVDKPKASIKETSHAYLNHKFYYPGRLEWETINMTFASVTQPDATAVLDAITQFAGYGVPNDVSPESQLATLGKNKFGAALGRTIDIVQVDANGLDIEVWQLTNPFFTSIQYGGLDYSSEDIVEIQTTVRYDWARLVSSDPLTGASTSDGASDGLDTGTIPGINSPGYP